MCLNIILFTTKKGFTKEQQIFIILVEKVVNISGNNFPVHKASLRIYTASYC